MFEFLKQASKSPWGAFFYLGVIFVIASVTGQFAMKSEYTSIREAFLPFLFLSGVALIGYCAWRDWVAHRPAPALPSKPDASIYKVEVTNSKSGEKRHWPDDVIVLEGKVKRDPKADGLDFWYIPSGTAWFWPSRLAIDDNKKWRLVHKISNFEEDDRRVFRFVVVGSNAQVLYRAYKDLNDTLATPAGKKYEPLHALTDDVYTCIEHTVFLKKQKSVS
jgi:hypothetical protein